MESHQEPWIDLFANAPLAPRIGKPIKQFGRAKAMHNHPRSDSDFIKRLFADGYVAYLKMKGVHARIYLRHTETEPVIMIGQRGDEKTSQLEKAMRDSLLRLFPGAHRTCLEGFYSVSSGRLYIFDVTVVDGTRLYLPFRDRHQRVPRIHGAKDIVYLPLMGNRAALFASVRGKAENPDLDGIVPRKTRGRQRSVSYLTRYYRWWQSLCRATQHR